MQRTTAGMPHQAARKRLIEALMTTVLATPLALSAAPPASAASGDAARDPVRDQLRDAGCQTLTQRVAAIPGSGPVMLASYEPAPGGEPLPGPLKESAFVYDNALAGIALIACGQKDAARRIADGVVAGVTRDRHYHDGRIRNAYRAGAMPADGPLPLPGWWDAKASKWFEDRYQVGTATGNVAWAALLLLAAYDATRTPRHLDTARTMMGWVDKETYNGDAPAAFIGGYFGHEPSPQRQGWKSTEHNVDTYAVFRWLSRYDSDPRWRTGAERSRKFVETMWQPGEGRFAIGTRDDGRSLNGGPSALDASLWPLIAVPDAAGNWQRALAWARAKHGVKGGYGFNANPDGIWTEGTGQAALVLRATGRDGEAAPLWPMLVSQRAPSGYLFATPEQRVRTGLQIGPDSKTDDFYYFHLPHLGATAWAVLAAAGWNPFQPGGCRGASCAAATQAAAPPDNPPKE